LSACRNGSTGRIDTFGEDPNATLCSVGPAQFVGAVGPKDIGRRPRASRAQPLFRLAEYWARQFPSIVNGFLKSAPS
jgi:hypothetical protein